MAIDDEALTSGVRRHSSMRVPTGFRSLAERSPVRTAALHRLDLPVSYDQQVSRAASRCTCISVNVPRLTMHEPALPLCARVFRATERDTRIVVAAR